MLEHDQVERQLSVYRRYQSRQEERKRRVRGLPVVDRVVLLAKLIDECDPNFENALTPDKARSIAEEYKK